MYSGHDSIPPGLVPILVALFAIYWSSRRRRSDPPPAEDESLVRADGDGCDADEIDELDPEEAARDTRTRERMVALGVTPIRWFASHLSESTVVPRPRAEIVERLCGLTLLGAKACRMDRREAGPSLAELGPLIREQEARHDPRWLFTGPERDFIDAADPPPDQRVSFAWRFEAASVMLWALNLIDVLPAPGQPCDPDLLVDSMTRCRDLPDRGVRSASELRDEQDLVNRCHAVAGMAYFRGLPVPDRLDLDILEERRTALDWLTRDIRWYEPSHFYERDERGRLVMLKDGAARPEWVIFPAKLPDPEQNARSSLDQMLRKRESERLLAELNLPVYPWMPETPGVDEARFWDWPVVFGRLVGVGIVAIKAGDLLSGSPPAFVFNDIKEKVDRYRIYPTLSPKERTFIDDPAPSSFDLTQFCWRAESAWLLMWALGLVDEPMGPPYHQVDFDRFRDIYWLVIENKRLSPRDPAEILDEYDLTFRCYWPAQYFHQRGIEQPPGYDRNVLIERHHALQWLVYGSDWDDWSGEGDDDEQDEVHLQ